MPAVDQVHIFTLCGVESEVPRSIAHSVHDHAAIEIRVFRNLPCGSLEGSLENDQSGSFVSGAFTLRALDGIDGAQQDEPAARNDSFRHRGLGRADGILERFLAIFHLGFGGSPDADDRDSAGKLGEPLLQFFLVIIGSRLLDLLANLVAAAIDCVLRCRRLEQSSSFPGR